MKEEGEGYSNILSHGTRGQVAIFIIMGILIVSSVVLFFMLSNGFQNSGMSSEASEVYDFVQGCIDEIYLDLIYSVGMKGGYYNYPIESISYGIPIYKMENKVNVPELNYIEKEIASGFNKKLGICVGNFSSFRDIDIAAGQINSMIDIRDEKIILNVDYPISVVKNERKDLLVNFKKIEIPLQMGLMYGVASEIIGTEDMENICLTCLAELAEDNDFNIDIVDYDEDYIIFIISHEELDGSVFEFTFGVKL